jgi:hypothetical protein
MGIIQAGIMAEIIQTIMEAIHMLGIMEHIIQAITAVDIEKSEV